jgi:hypothetical protein
LVGLLNSAPAHSPASGDSRSALSGEGSVLNPLPTHAVCNPYRLNHRHRRQPTPADYVI